MMPARDEALARLQNLLGPEAFASGSGRDGMSTDAVTVSPSSEEEVSAVVRACGEAGAALIPVGGGTQMEVGSSHTGDALHLSVSRLNGLVEHDDANLTVTARAGMTAAELQAVLAPSRQFVVLETPRPERATLGGLAATNLNGYRRTAYRSIRDLFIGLRVVTGTGEVVKAGGKVVKNVAGYDMCKLFIGSLGTLGVITQTTTRVEPLPEAEMTLLISARAAGEDGANGTLRAAVRVAAAGLLPTAVALVNPAAADRLIGERRDTALVRLEGFSAVIARQERDVRATASGGIRRVEVSDHASLWQRLLALGWDGSGGLIRVMLPLSDLPGAWSALSAIAEGGEMAADLLSGTVWLAPQPDGFRQGLEAITSLTERTGGHRMIVRIPQDSTALPALPRWHPAPRALPLMAGLKRTFDPHGILNPGRFLV